MSEYRYQLRVACAWRTCAELMRRHHTRQLRVLLCHPCGGQVRQLYLQVDEPELARERQFCRPLLGLSYSDCQARLFSTFTGRSSKGDYPTYPYVARLTEAKDPKGIIDEIERFVGLPDASSSQLPPTTPPVLMIRMIAAAADRYMLAREVFEAECAWEDTAGYSTGISERLRDYRSVADSIPWHSESAGEQARATAKYWFVGFFDDGWTHQARALLDLRGKVYRSANPGDTWDVWEEFVGNGHKLRPLVNRLVDDYLQTD